MWERDARRRQTNREKERLTRGGREGGGGKEGRREGGRDRAEDVCVREREHTRGRARRHTRSQERGVKEID